MFHLRALFISFEQMTCEANPVHWVKIAHSFLQSVSNLFYFIILNLPIYSYIWLLKIFSKLTSNNREIGLFNLESRF